MAMETLNRMKNTPFLTSLFPVATRILDLIQPPGLMLPPVAHQSLIGLLVSAVEREGHGNLQPTWRETRNFTDKQWNFATLEFPTHVRTNCPYWKKEHWPGVSMTEGTLLMVKLWLYPILSKNIDATDSCKNTTQS